MDTKIYRAREEVRKNKERKKPLNDFQISEIVGCSRSTARQARLSLKQEATRPIPLPEDIKPLLGKIADTEIRKRMGYDLSTIRRWREDLKIKSYKTRYTDSDIVFHPTCKWIKIGPIYRDEDGVIFVPVKCPDCKEERNVRYFTLRSGRSKSCASCSKIGIPHKKRSSVTPPTTSST